jgi:hypothetical protein
MKRALIRGFAAIAGCLTLALAMTGGTAVAASPGIMATPPETGISWTTTGDGGQCNGPSSQWVVSPDWTTPIRFNTDGRSGGCQFAFGIRDLGAALTGLSIDYIWDVSPGGDARQCSNRGQFQLPITQYLLTGAQHIVDTDNKSGFCNLTFLMSGRTDIGLDVQFWPDGDADQCRNYRTQGTWQTVRPGVPITLGINTDDRSGGCWFSLRLRQF